MSNLVLPKRANGTMSAADKAVYFAARRAFCDAVLQVNSTLDFKVSARGWAYIFENRGVITKDELDACQKLINECRKTGELPLDICSVDESRSFEGVEYIDDIIKVEIVTSGDKVTKKFLKDFKERLKESLRQVDILITTHGIQVI